MWNVLPKMAVLKFIAVIFALTIFAMLTAFEEQHSTSLELTWNGTKEVLTKVSLSTIISYYLIIIFAKWCWIPFWKYSWLGSNKLNQSICPNLNGKWVGITTSSFKDKNGNKIKTNVEMTIVADFLGFNIALKSTDKYQESTVIQSEIYKDPRNGKFSISYVFEAKVNKPEETDDSKFDGAAKLDVSFENNKPILKGKYWTNRNYQRNMQTAGDIELFRAE